MPRFEVDWRMKGSAVVEADDLAEARSVVAEAVENFESYRLDEVDIEDVETLDAMEVDD